MLKFSLNLLGDLQPRAITRDLDWGVPIPLDGWRDRPDKRIYVWFDAVIGYLSASIEWARRSGDPDAWRAWWQDPEALAYYFMGKDNIVFHSEIWPAMLLGYGGKGSRAGKGRTKPGSLGALNLPSEVVSSEYLTMEGRKFSSSRSVVIYVRDFLTRYDVDALRYYVAVAGPENQDTDFTWSEFIRRNNDELVANWGNLVNRSISFAARNIGSIPEAWRAHRRRPRAARGLEAGVRQVGESLSQVAVQGRDHRDHAHARRGEQVPVRPGAVEAARVRPRADEDDPARRAAACRRRQDAADPVPAALVAAGTTRCSAATGTWADMPRIDEVNEDGGAPYPVITGDYSGAATWGSAPIRPGTALAAPTPLFAKIDPDVVVDELNRLGGYDSEAEDG